MIEDPVGKNSILSEAGWEKYRDRGVWNSQNYDRIANKIKTCQYIDVDENITPHVQYFNSEIVLIEIPTKKSGGKKSQED